MPSSGFGTGSRKPCSITEAPARHSCCNAAYGYEKAWCIASPGIAAVQAAAALTPTQLRCEYLVDPEAVQTPHPRLTWLLQSPERGARQSAYRILVASSTELLAGDNGDLWDTGKRQSRETVNIEYAGKPLASGRAYWWKVQVWDGSGQASPWSAPARWTTGLDRQDWIAQWISFDYKTPLHRSRTQLYLPPARLYRKNFPVAKTIRRATFYGSALGIFDAYVNGRRVSDASPKRRGFSLLP